MDSMGVPASGNNSVLHDLEHRPKGQSYDDDDHREKGLLCPEEGHPGSRQLH